MGCQVHFYAALSLSRQKHINKTSRSLESGISCYNVPSASQRLLMITSSGGGFATECSLSVPRKPLQPVAMVLQGLEQLSMFS